MVLNEENLKEKIFKEQYSEKLTLSRKKVKKPKIVFIFPYGLKMFLHYSKILIRSEPTGRKFYDCSFWSFGVQRKSRIRGRNRYWPFEVFLNHKTLFYRIALLTQSLNANQEKNCELDIS